MFETEDDESDENDTGSVAAGDPEDLEEVKEEGGDESNSWTRCNSWKPHNTGATPSQSQFYPKGWTEVTDNAKNQWCKYLLEEGGFPKKWQVEAKIKEFLTTAIAEYKASGGELEEGRLSKYQFQFSSTALTFFIDQGYYPQYIKGMVKFVDPFL